MNSVDKMLSEKGKLIFIVNKFKFSFHKLLQNGQHRYKCTKRGCTANLKVLENDDIVWTSCNLVHKYHKRLNLPRSIQEVHDILKNIDVKTYEGNTFLQVNNAEKGILLFSTDENLKFLSQSTTFYVDGIFSYCAQFFYQFFTIHVIKNNHYVPLVFTLLKDKKQESYVDIFQIIDNYCLSYNNVFNLESIYVDFEIAIHNAINDVWPLTKVRGCRFHLGQS